MKCIKKIFTAVCCLTFSAGMTLSTAMPVINSIAEDLTAVSSETGVSFANTSMQAGVPIKVSLNGITSSDVSYQWSVDGKKISAVGDSYTPTENDYEKMISVTVSADGKTYTASAYFSQLPVVYINTDEEITSKEEYIYGNCKIQGNDKFNNVSQLYSGTIQIRGRGNYTWVHDKKPYKIKLDTKSDLFGMGASKHWVLMAEYMDPTHLRNEIMPEISETLGFDYTANSEAVAVVLNGEYNGLYHLGENVRIAENRVNIYDWEETAENIAKALYKIQKSSGMTKDDRDNLEESLSQNLEWVSSGEFSWNNTVYKVSDFVTLPSDIDGGYLLELDTYDAYHAKQVSDFETTGQQPIQFKSPEYAVTNSEMYSYAKNYIQSFENAVSADDFYTVYDGKNQHYSELFDMDSLVNYWLMLELSSNCDGMRYSNFMYKDFGEKFKMGPSWDYDWTWNASYIVPADQWWTDQNYYNQTVHWYKYLVKDPFFLTKAFETYQAHKDEFAEIYREGGKIDTYSEMLSVPAVADLAKWHSDQNFQTEVSKTKNYVSQRFQWLDKQFSSVETLASSLGYKASDKLSVTDISADGSQVSLTAQVNESSAESVSFHVNGLYAGESKINGNNAVLSVSADLLQKSDTALNTVQIYIKDKDGNYIKSDNQSSQNPWERGRNWWEQESSSESQSTVCSDFRTFTLSELGISISVKGDVNADGAFNVADLVLLQKWLVAVPDVHISDWKNADFCQDNVLNAFDLLLMRRELLNNSNLQ